MPLARRGASRQACSPRGGSAGVKDPRSRADPVWVTHPPVADRRAPRSWLEVPPRRGLARLGAALREGLYRRLADDEGRVAYWVRHVRYGVLLSEISAATVFGYVLRTTSAGHDNPYLLGMAGFVMLAVPGLLLLPLAEMMRDHRGPTMFYAWTLTTTTLILIGTRLDGGPSSPIDAMLFLTLTYMAVAYSPYGVVAMGSLMTVGYLLFVELPGLTTSGLFFLAVMALFTLICAMVSANSWAAYDRQILLIRTQEALAATDPLTGIPNRRAFLDRLSSAVSAAAWGHATVVCLVDLDRFKAVNDEGGHAAGDAVLVAVGAALGAAVRETDTVARLGGDEFAVLAATSVSCSGEQLAERLRTAVATVGARSGVTASVGTAEVEPGDDVEDLLYRADAAMYRAKSAGGNRVVSGAF
jgi:diguanylate cyclase (GGDEF)-like protein